MDTFLQDIKFGLRRLLNDKGFLITAALTLALCIGANTAIFAVINAVILRPLPFADADRLVTMWNAYPGATGGDPDIRGSNGAPDYFDRRALTDVFAEVANYQSRGASIDIDGTPQRITARAVTPSFFPLLRAQAAHGRTFTEEEGERGNEQVVILSHGLWEELYGADPAIVGSQMRISGSPHTVVGVMPPDFVFLSDNVRLWVPLAYTEEQRQEYHSNSWQMIARLQRGATLAAAQERVDALNAANMDRFPEIKPLLIDAGFHTPVRFLQQDLVRNARRVLYLLWGGAGFVLLIGCVNVANLVLVRSTARTQELATRFALGAPRLRVVRQIVTESLLLTLAGGGVGVLLGWAGLRAFDWLGAAELPLAADVSFDATAVAFTFVLAIGIGALIAVIPLGSVLRLRLASAFHEGGRGGTAGRGQQLLRKGLIAAQVALALVLLAGAGLLLASFRQLLAVDPGFDPGGVLTGTVVLSESRYPEDADTQRFAERVLEEIRALPGVEAAGITSQIPFGSGFSDSVIFAEGYVMREGESAISPSRNVITPGYLDTMRIELLEGRDFDSRDTADGRQVMLIDERLAERFWPDGDALGKRMWRPRDLDAFTNPESRDYFDIVGIVETIRMRGLSGQGEPPGAYYFPLVQETPRGLDLAVRTAVEPTSLAEPVRRIMTDADPELPLFDVNTMDERIDASLSDRRLPLLLTTVFSAVAVLLAAVGIFGVFAYLVQLRTREIGIRMALGGDTRSVFRLVLSEGAFVLGIGLAVGLGGAVALRRFIESQLFGVSALDPAVLGVVAATLASVGLAACALPARRAAAIDPVRALGGS